MKDAAFFAAALAILSLLAGALVCAGTSCTPAEQQQAARIGHLVLNLDVTRCIEKAVIAGRTDLISACKGEGIKDALDLLDRALAEQVCSLPDAGGQ